jgi:hypothetical protein
MVDHVEHLVEEAEDHQQQEMLALEGLADPPVEEEVVEVLPLILLEIAELEAMAVLELQSLQLTSKYDRANRICRCSR